MPHQDILDLNGRDEGPAHLQHLVGAPDEPVCAFVAVPHGVGIVNIKAVWRGDSPVWRGHHRRWHEG